jgi:prevent-host-death family protein
MPTFNMLDAKSNLSRLVEAVESGREKEIIIARNGRHAARLVPIETQHAGQRIGIAKGKFADLEPDPALDAEIEKLFTRGG